eukprot:SAG11_NODE_159_length_14027_cov_6.893667_6_plen_66_part_00
MMENKFAATDVETSQHLVGTVPDIKTVRLVAFCTTAAKGKEVLALDATHAAEVAQQIEVDKQLNS